MSKDIDERTFEFAVRIVKLCKFLNRKTAIEKTLANQLLRSGTSVGANVQEAQARQSRPDFISKMSIALKESRETLYWLRILEEAELLTQTQVYEIKQEADEITKIIGAIIVSTKNQGK